MLTSSRIRSVYLKIIDFHGRVENIKLYDVQPPTEKEEEEKESKKKTAKKTGKKTNF